jgi:hypothetical protein
MTLSQAEAKLVLWEAAEDAVATGQSYTIGSRSLTRASLSEIRKQLVYYRGLVTSIQAGRGSGVRVMRIVPRDV